MEQYAKKQLNTVLITGASKGLGYAMAKKFSDNGWNVFGTSTTQEGLDGLMESIPGVQGAVCDVRDEQSVKAAVHKMHDIYGSIDVLINNAGMPSRKNIDAITSEHFLDVLHVNVGGVFNFTKEVIPYMKTHGIGRIINIDSISGLQPYGGATAYVASKYALTGFAKSVRHEVHADNIQVCNIYPGGIQTGFHSTPRPEFMLPEEVAGTVYFVTTRPWNAHIPELTVVPARDTRIP